MYAGTEEDPECAELSVLQFQSEGFVCFAERVFLRGPTFPANFMQTSVPLKNPDVVV